jgi:hypothetical protein
MNNILMIVRRVIHNINSLRNYPYKSYGFKTQSMIENAAVLFLQPSLIKSIINHTGAILNNNNNNNNKNNIRT